jgi:serine protease Do
MAAWVVACAVLQLAVGAGPEVASPTLFTEGAAPPAPASAVSAGTGSTAGMAAPPRPAPVPSTGAAAIAPPAAGGLPDLTRLASSSLRAVVGVVTTQSAAPASTDDSVRELFDKLHEGPRKGIGSGFIIHRDGWILTNAHVVEGAETVEVDLGQGARRLPARIVGMDSEADVALLKIASARPLAFLPLGDSDRVAVAQWVMVIGSPFGLDHSVTVGIISHTGRTEISPVGRPGSYDFLQTDASINPGNSGGPLIDLAGNVIGMATAVNASGQGIGFAIPINLVKAIVGQLKERGRVVRSWLGVSVRELPGDPDPDPPGVEVTEVATGGPADVAGLKTGDVIVDVLGHAIRTPARLRWYVSTAGVGREVELRLRRRGADDRAITVKLGEVPTQERARAEAKPSVGQ